MKVKTFAELGIEIQEGKKLIGDSIKIDRLLNKQITVLDYKIAPSDYTGQCLYLQVVVSDTKRVIFTSAKKLMEVMTKTTPDSLPFTTIIIKEEDGSFKFT